MTKMGPTTAGYVDRLAGTFSKIARAKAGMSQRELAKPRVSHNRPSHRINPQPPTLLPVLARILAAVDLDMRITLSDYGSPR